MDVFLALALVCAGAARLQEPSSPGPAFPSNARVERRLEAMGTWLELRLELRPDAGEDRAAGLAASERAVQAIEACEARLSTWREDSELARLNRAPVGAAPRRARGESHRPR